MISCCLCFGTKTTSKDEGITIGDKEDPIILQPKVSVKVSIILSSYTLAWLLGLDFVFICYSLYMYYKNIKSLNEFILKAAIE